MTIGSGYEDSFALDNMPAGPDLPEFLFNEPHLQFPRRLNCANELLKKPAALGLLDKTAIIGSRDSWSFQRLLDQSNRVANVLTKELGMKTGNRVLLRGFNGPMMAAAWLGVLKAGGIAVATMPMLRAVELEAIINKAEVNFALCDRRLYTELAAAERRSFPMKAVALFGDGEITSSVTSLEDAMARASATFECAETSADDIALIAFTSGTTGAPKGAMHTHRDVMTMCVCVGDHLVKPSSEDVFIGSPPLAFTFGLGMLLTIPLWSGASVVLLENPAPPNLAKGIADYGATICATAPTAYRALLAMEDEVDLSSLKTTVSAGEPLPVSVFDAWASATGIEMIDGLGATEMIHIFVGSSGKEIRRGYIGKALPGYTISILDEDYVELPAGQVGLLAVKGPTGCKYLNDARQKVYVVNGWNVTGDSGVIDEEGYFRFVARSDDMIISSGYNISPIEIESALLTHAAVAECAVVGVPDESRGHIAKAFIVRADGVGEADAELAEILQSHVKATIAPYKYPRAIEFMASLPRTTTGKVQRYVLRERP